MELTTFDHLKAQERPKDERDILLGSGQAPVAIPSTFLPDNSWLKVNFQGQTPWCGEHAGTHLKTILDFVASGGEQKVRKTPRYGAIKFVKDPQSPAYDGFPLDAGTDMRSIFKWLQKVGAADFEPLENNVLLSLIDYCNRSVITPAMDANAAKGTNANYGFGKTDFQSLCQYAYQSKAVLILLKCDNGLWGTAIPAFTNPKYGHFVVMDGYDETSIRVIDSAEPNPNFAVKTIARKYVTPRFFYESGTAIDPAQVQAIKSAIVSDAAGAVQDVAQDTLTPAPVKATILEQIVEAVESIL